MAPPAVRASPPLRIIVILRSDARHGQCCAPFPRSASRGVPSTQSISCERPIHRKGVRMSVYIIAQIDIHDRDGYRRYEEGFPSVFSQFKGELLVVSENPT